MSSEKQRPIYLRVNRELYEHLDKKSIKNRCTVQEYIRELIIADYSNIEVNERDISLLKKASKEIALALFSELGKALNDYETSNEFRMERTIKNLQNILSILKQIDSKIEG